MSRGERFDVAPEMDTHRRTAWKPRSRRILWQEPMLYRVSGMAEWNAGTVQNISKSGVSFAGVQRIENGIELEMLFVMPQEITGQPNSKVLCRGDVARVIGGSSGNYAAAVAMSGYSLLPDV